MECLEMVLGDPLPLFRTKKMGKIRFESYIIRILSRKSKFFQIFLTASGEGATQAVSPMWREREHDDKNTQSQFCFMFNHFLCFSSAQETEVIVSRHI